MFPKRHPTESLLFLLHYKVTSPFLLVCSLLVAFNVFYAEPMTCSSRDDISHTFVTSYCWSHGTFSMIHSMKKEVGIEVPYPGIDIISGNPDDYVFHSYYRWIHLILLVQAVLFYLPKAMWTYLEGGKFQDIENHVHRIKNLSSNDDKDHERSQKLRSFSLYLGRNSGNFNAYARYYYSCEAICLSNVIFQLFWLNLLFNGDFLSFGSQLYQSYQAQNQHLFSILPMVTICRVYRYGSSGHVQRSDAMCNLPVNALTEKIYVFLLVWFLLLLVLGFLGLFKIFLTEIFRKVRQIRLQYIIGFKWHGPKEDRVTSDAVVQFGDWYVLTCISKCINVLDFKTLLSNLNDTEKKIVYSNDIFEAVSSL